MISPEYSLNSIKWQETYSDGQLLQTLERFLKEQAINN